LIKSKVYRESLLIPWTDQKKLEYAYGRFEKIYPIYPAIAQVWLVEIARLEKKISSTTAED